MTRTKDTTQGIRDNSLRPYALVAGIGYAVLFFLAIFANFFVREGLIVAGDAAQTAANIRGAEPLFRLGLVSFLAVFLIDVAVAWGLYVLFGAVDRNLSLLAAWFRVVYTVFLGVALIFFFQALQLLGGSGFLSAFSADQLNTQAMVALDSFNSTWLIGLVAFGVHLVLIGTLIIKSGRAPKVLGWFLIASGLSYIFDTTAHSLLADYEKYATLLLVIVAAPSVVAEGWFGLWLLLRGGKPAANASAAAGTEAPQNGG